MKKQKGAVPKLVHPLFLLTINYCQPGFCTKLVFKTNSSVGNGLNQRLSLEDHLRPASFKLLLGYWNK